MDIQLLINAPSKRIEVWNSFLLECLDLRDNGNKKQTLNSIAQIKEIECYNAFPSLAVCHRLEFFLINSRYEETISRTRIIITALNTPTADYKQLTALLLANDLDEELITISLKENNKYYFEVLVVMESSATEPRMIEHLVNIHSEEDFFTYQLIFVDSFEKAIKAVLINFNIKCCIISDRFQKKSEEDKGIAFKTFIDKSLNNANSPENQAENLAASIFKIRQNEIDIYYCSRYYPEKVALYQKKYFKKVFCGFDDYFELHFTLLESLRKRFATPLFDSLKKYSYESRCSFHALPIARGGSVFQSRCLQDMAKFYGKTIFLAESSSTGGGLDSLMNPTGSILEAMEKASEFFGSHYSFFETNGTSAANKIVLQTLLAPGDIVLLEHSCHESHHYGIILTGSYPIFLKGYSLEKIDIAGPILLREIKKQLLALKREGLLDRVKLLILSNCTFDGLVYNVQQYMEELLAIKPDLVFFWDEAWFAYARCVPHYRFRTAMFSAAQLHEKYTSSAYRLEYAKFKITLEEQGETEEFYLNNRLLADPDRVSLRVFSTQSIHKTLSSFRQGSMIHVYDHCFHEIKEMFVNAFITHSTTSPNYQILATMDLARRQADLEGFEMIQKAIELAMIFRQEVNHHPLISQFFEALSSSEMIPEELRHSKVTSDFEHERDWLIVEQAWRIDDIVLDPTRVTLLIKQGISGIAMKRLLMDRFKIQINKVSLNTILLQFHIGISKSSVARLLAVLLEIAHLFCKKNIMCQRICNRPVVEFGGFAKDFLLHPNLPAGDLRGAYYLGQLYSKTEIFPFEKIREWLEKGKTVVCAAIIIPYPPGYPVLLPGQLISLEILDYLDQLDINSIIAGGSKFAGHSLLEGIKVFREEHGSSANKALL